LFLHIGDSQIVPVKDIVGIFNLKNKEKEVNKQFLEYASSNNTLNKEDYNYYKSFVVTTDDVFLSPISSHTLGKRKLR